MKNWKLFQWIKLALRNFDYNHDEWNADYKTLWRPLSQINAQKLIQQCPIHRLRQVKLDFRINNSDFSVDDFSPQFKHVEFLL